jgi:hypothetical protein
MATASLSLPTGLGSSVIYGCSGPRHTGVSFRLRLQFRDETQAPPVQGQFDHEWEVSRQELDQAEQLGRSDQELLARRDREERIFLSNLERRLSRDKLRLERVGRDLVLRRAAA